jgi:hypothetical protein
MLVKALLSLRPGSEWTLNGDTYEGLNWLDTIQTKPSLEDISNEITRLTELESSLEYQQLRRAEYPSFAEQFDTLYHGGYDAWKASIQVIKDKYPKY